MDTSASSRRSSEAFIYYLENKDNESWTINLTRNVRLAKRYFTELALGKMGKDEVAKCVSKLLEEENGIETRFTVHLALFLHTNHPDVEEMEMTYDLRAITPTFSAPLTISTDDYNWMVSELGLDAHFKYQKEAATLTLSDTENNDNNVTDSGLLEQLMDPSLSVLAPNELRERRDDIVRQAFRDGVHSRYERQDHGLMNILGSIRMKTRSISIMTGPERQMFVDEIYQYALQNPILTMTVLVTNTVRIRNCVLLEELRVFLDLPIGEPNSTPQFPSETRLIEFALYKAIREFDETSPMWYFFYAGLSILANENFIQLAKLVEILKIIIKEFASFNTVENLGNVIKLFKSLITPYLEENKISTEELMKLKGILSTVLHATYMADENPAVMNPRMNCLSLLKLINENLTELGHPDIEESSELPINDGSTLQLGLICIRRPWKVEAVEKCILDQAEDPKWSSIEAVGELVDDAVVIIIASCRLEYEGVTKFIRILVQNRPILQRLGLHYFMNRILSAGFQSRSVSKSKFFGFFSSHLAVIQKEDGEEFAVAYEAHLELTKTIVSLVFGIHKSSDGVKLGHAILNKKARLSAMILDVLYELVEWAHGLHVVYPDKVKEEILEVVTLIPTFAKGSNAHSGCGLRYNKVLAYLKGM